MSVSGTINDNVGRIGSVSQVSGSVSSGNELVVTRVTVPQPQQAHKVHLVLQKIILIVSQTLM